VGRQCVSFWADGIYVNVRLEDAPHQRQCLLVIVAATAEGRKELLAVSDGYRESEQSGYERLLDLEAARLDLGAAIGGRRRGAGLLGRVGQGRSPNPRPALLAAQDGQRPG
jgi:hypothetical protein